MNHQDDRHRVIKAYANNMYNNVGYVTISYLMENTGCDKLEIINCLMDEGYEEVRDGVYTLYEDE